MNGVGWVFGYINWVYGWSSFNINISYELIDVYGC